MPEWIVACAVDDVDEEDVIRFDHHGRTFAIYRSPDDEFFATDGLCTHEKVHLADGLVMEADGGWLEVTVRVASLLVALPAAFETTARKRAPLSLVVTEGMV